MTSLPSLLGGLITALQVHPICRKVRVIETKQFSSDQFFFKIRAEMTGGYRLQIRVYYNHRHIDYAYQFFTDVPLMRWDNKEEFRHLATYPHHHHDVIGDVKPSALTGDPTKDITIVLKEISVYISNQE